MKALDFSVLQDFLRRAADERPPIAAGPSRGMVASLKLEAIGDHLRPYQRDPARALHMLRRVPHAHRLRLLDSSGPWVARITGRDRTYGLAREFIRPLRDYRDASASGKSGIALIYMLHEGVYEVHEWLSWSRERRYFVRSERGKLVELTLEEVHQWLSA